MRYKALDWDRSFNVIEGGFLNKRLDHARNIVYQAVDAQLIAHMDLRAFRLYLAELCGLTFRAYQSARQINTGCT